MRRIWTAVILLLGALELIVATWYARGLLGWNFPQRPSGLPVGAIFAGGPDGGEWVACEPTLDDRIVCLIYDPTGGEKRYERSMRICPGVSAQSPGASGQLVPRSLDAEVGHFDGVTAFLDRPIRYFPRDKDSQADIEHEEELATKYYVAYGVNQDCKFHGTKLTN
jgi:hypothetical protein